MYLTEEEARRKTCIIQLAALMGLASKVGKDDGKLLAAQRYCLASECMDWPKCNKAWGAYSGPRGKP